MIHSSGRKYALAAKSTAVQCSTALTSFIEHFWFFSVLVFSPIHTYICIHTRQYEYRQGQMRSQMSDPCRMRTATESIRLGMSAETRDYCVQTTMYSTQLLFL